MLVNNLSKISSEAGPTPFQSLTVLPTTSSTPMSVASPFLIFLITFLAVSFMLGTLLEPINSGIKSSNSLAIVELSSAPISKASSNIFLNASGLSVLPTISFHNISKLSATDAPEPTWPLAIANELAVVMFLI